MAEVFVTLTRKKGKGGTFLLSYTTPSGKVYHTRYGAKLRQYLTRHSDLR